MIGPVTDAVTSMEIRTTMSTATTVLVAAVAPTLAELVWNEINRSRIRKAAAPSSTTISLSNTMNSLRTLRGGGGIGSVDSKRKTKTGYKQKNRTIEPKKKQQPQNSPINDDDNNNNTHNHNKDLATRGKSVAFMALGMALHYLGK
jgi:hypothetical protein